MSDQATLQCTLEMMIILSRSGGIRIEDLSEYFIVHKRTVQRTIQTIRDAGFIIDFIHGRYKINRIESKKLNRFDISDLLHFSKEEAWMLNEEIQNLPCKNTMKENLQRKLYSIYENESIIKTIIKNEDSDMIRIIYESIQSKQQMIV
jgi:predicted DNA-binding transcriptional regulator YafY